MDKYNLQSNTLIVPEYEQAQKDIDAFRLKRNKFIEAYEPSMLNCCECRPC